ncbi:MAG: BNR repeat-containing protein [Planctomycetales bacterium]|nr:BNR repeat-containing protein [Planctomycetales bacterium]
MPYRLSVFCPLAIAHIVLLSHLITSSVSQDQFPIGEGWARTKVNCVIFRKSALCTYQNWQYAAYYDPQGRVTLARRDLNGGVWMVKTTRYTGNVADAHNCISLAVDGEGLLHVSWDHHGNPLRYCRSLEPGSLELTDQLSMVGTKEGRVTYPEFYALPNGDLLFFYRDGSSGNGDLVLNRYVVAQRQWQRVQDNLLGGEGTRNAYWQVAVDRHAAIHLSWVWRETGDVVTNHDIGYARSSDGGITWTNTLDEPYTLPIIEATAEYAIRIPQNSELANQTSMAVDYHGRPYIANFWRDSPAAVPQYRIVYHNGSEWKTSQVGRRTIDFHRSGGGTKRPPISRPMILLDSNDQKTRILVLYRDIERDRRISVAVNEDMTGSWAIYDITSASVGQADPLYDLQVWNAKREIHLFTQYVGQGDYETQEDVSPQTVSVIEWHPPTGQ